MTPEQRARYESARAQAEAVYLRSMMETNAIVTRARMPAKPEPASWWRRLFGLKHTHGVSRSSHQNDSGKTPMDSDSSP